MEWSPFTTPVTSLWSSWIRFYSDWLLVGLLCFIYCFLLAFPHLCSGLSVSASFVVVILTSVIFFCFLSKVCACPFQALVVSVKGAIQINFTHPLTNNSFFTESHWQFHNKGQRSSGHKPTAHVSKINLPPTHHNLPLKSFTWWSFIYTEPKASEEVERGEREVQTSPILSHLHTVCWLLISVNTTGKRLSCSNERWCGKSPGRYCQGDKLITD